MPQRLPFASILLVLAILFAFACGGGGGAQGSGLNQTTITCPPGRTLLDGVCVSEAIADYVACVRAQGAELGGSSGRKTPAEAGSLGVRAAGAAEVSETLTKKYVASDAASLEVVRRCNAV